MIRSKNRLILVLGVAAAVAIGIVAATAQGGGSASGKTTIRISGFEGPPAQGGPDFMNGMILATKLINKTGTVNGKKIPFKIDLKIYKTGGTPEGAASAYRAAGQDKSTVGSFIGAAGALALRGLSPSVKLATIAASGNDSIDFPIAKYLFSNSQGREYATSSITYAVKKLHKTSFSAIHYETDFSSQIPFAIKSVCPVLKCELLDVESSTSSASVDEVTPQLTKMRAANPQAYYIESLNVNAVKAARQLGLFTKPIMTEQWLSTPALAQACGTDCQDMVFGGHKCRLTDLNQLLASDRLKKFCQTYIANFSKQFPKLPFQLYSIYGYDAVTTYAYAAWKVLDGKKPLTRDNVLAEMENLHGDLFTSHGKVYTSSKRHRLTGTWTEAYIDMTIKIKDGQPTWVLAPKADKKGSDPGIGPVPPLR